MNGRSGDEPKRANSPIGEGNEEELDRRKREIEEGQDDSMCRYFSINNGSKEKKRFKNSPEKEGGK